MRVVFTVSAGPHQGQRFEFAGHDTFIVGRSKQAHFRLPEKDEYFSRIHFLVEVNPPSCRLLDMGSTNGTFVNGQKTTVAELRHGDLIQGGQTVLRVSLEPGEEGAEPVPVPLPPLPGAEASIPVPLPAAEAGAEKGSTVDYVALTGPLCPSCNRSMPVGQPGAVGANLLCAECRETIHSRPQLIKGYHVLRELGRGGMGVISLAVRTADDSLVALKTILPTSDVTTVKLTRFIREANILRSLDHPNIVAFRDIGESNGHLYLAMDYVPGIDARRLLTEHGPLAIPRAVRLVCQLLEALEYAHARGFVHRDIKPANVQVTEEGGREVARLIDFGLARVYQASQLSGLTLTDQRGGTIAFMAPEQITHFREARPPVDQYAAAATLYTLLTGRYTHNFPAAYPKRLLMVLQDPPVPLLSRRPEVPPELAEAIHRALAKEPDQRFPNAWALREALVPFTT
jgi:serine/threonine-protein kinase